MNNKAKLVTSTMKGTNSINQIYKFNTTKGNQKKEIACIKFTGKEMILVLHVFPVLLTMYVYEKTNFTFHLVVMQKKN